MAACLETQNRTPAGRPAIERDLVEGGMATVCLARDLKHNRMTGVAPRR